MNFNGCKSISEGVYTTYYDYEGLPKNLGLKIEKVTDILEKYDIKYRYYIDVHEVFDGEEETAYYDYTSKFEFDEEVSEDIMSKLEKEIEKELKYSEVYPEDNMLGFIVPLGSGDEDDLFESKINENLHDIEHLVLFPDDLTDEEKHARLYLLAHIGDISELTDSMGDIYITSMKEVPEDKNEPYYSKTRVTITFDGDDVNEENLEKVIEFINYETVFESPEIESDNEISFNFNPIYI